MSDFKKLINDYRLTTAEIFYHFPDHPSLIQTYLWQEFDLTPDFPNLMKFLNFWDRSLEGKLHSVSVASCEIIKSSDFHFFDNEFTLH